MAKVTRRCPCFQPEEDDVSELDYCHCGLEDVPNDVFLYERTLEVLYLDCNQIRVLPRPLFHCHGLKKLGLSDNEIQSLPPAIASLINLEKLDISKNGVVAFPDNIKGCKNLLTVEASINPLGKLPDGFTQLINLGELYLNDTFLDFLPANFGRLSKLKILELRENRLKALPKSMARLTELTRLDIGQNEFYELPEVIGNLCKLEELWCDDNEISHLPSCLQNLKNLTYLDASNNNIEWFAPEVCHCKHLVDVRISNNSLHDLPDTIGNLGNLVTFKVDDNYIAILPSTIGSLHSLEELVVSQNELRTLPISIGLLRKLHTLYMDENSLTDLPAELGSCTSLTILSLRGNKLIRIPDELGHLSRLRVMNLSNNQIQYLPFNITKLQELQALWLSDNQNKPLIPLQSDYDSRTGQRVLTCFILPQQKHQVRDGEENSDTDSFHLSVWEEERERKQQIKFASDDQLDQPGKLIRAPTPYPKELKLHARHAKNQALKMKGPYQSSETDLSHPLEVNPQPPIPLRSSIQEAKVKVREAKVTKPSISSYTQDQNSNKNFLDLKLDSQMFQNDNESKRKFATSFNSNCTSEDTNFDSNKENLHMLLPLDMVNGNRHPAVHHPNVVRQTQENGKSDSSDSGCLSSVNYPRFPTYIDVNQGLMNSASKNSSSYNSHESPNIIRLYNDERRGSFKSTSDGSPSTVPPSPSFEQKQFEEKCRRDSKSSYERPRQLSSLPNAAHPNLIGIVQRSSPPPSPTHVKTLELVNKMRAATPPSCRMPSPPPSPHRQTPPQLPPSNFGMFSPTGLRRMSPSPPRIPEQSPRTFSFSGPAQTTMPMPNMIMPRSAPSSPGQSSKYQTFTPILTSNHVALTPTVNRRPTALYIPTARDCKPKMVLNRSTPSPPRCLPQGKECVPSPSCFMQRNNDGMMTSTIAANIRPAQRMANCSPSAFSYRSSKLRGSPTTNAPPMMEPGFNQPVPSTGNVVSSAALYYARQPMNMVAPSSSPIAKPPAYHIAAAYSAYPGIVADNAPDRPQPLQYTDAYASYNVPNSPMYYSGYPKPMYNDSAASDVVYKHPLQIAQDVAALPMAENPQVVPSDYSGPPQYLLHTKLALVDQTGMVDDASSSSNSSNNPPVVKSNHHPTNFTQDKPSCTNGLPLIVPTPHRPLGTKYANTSGSRKGSWVFGPHRNPQVFPVIILKNPGLGFSIVEGAQESSPTYPLQDTVGLFAIFVASVEPNGPASTALKPGDKILEMNGVDFSHVDYEKAINMLQNCGPTISLMVSRD